VSRSPVLGPRTVTLPAGGYATRRLTQHVPGAAPAGLYTYTLNAGLFPDAVSASGAFTFTKSGSAPAARTSGVEAPWPVEGWDAPAASASAPPDLRLNLPVPNPARDHVTLSF